ncbi:UNVERIFIED_CONTAM: YTH domain-containing protein ECT4 [Sesamum angustifolium]|uniref:YTH domain-containing family protein n=1 Tax=Sesamum angustifolium TaxID=2727405 RepID=A0AAW2QB48_9LAMI
MRCCLLSNMSLNTSVLLRRFIFLTDVRCAMRMSYLDLYLRYPAVRRWFSVHWPREGIHPATKFSSFANRNPGVFMQYGPVHYQSNGRVWNNNYRYRSRENFGRNAEFEALTELTRGPSEDDVHKCIKYDVWSSTPNGNRKLDAAFREADAKTNETDTKCPVFLFFSLIDLWVGWLLYLQVNGSGQFVGVAEMLGQVDFSKNMDFWQLDKWNGFFPIKWHIIKDVPNALLRHIILENNENRPVTYSRDTQEIGLKQGLEMLSIFKTHSGKTSVLDDFNFYEDREKSLKAKRNSRAASQTNGFQSGDRKKRSEGGEGIIREQPTRTNEPDPSSLISLTKNLSLNSQPLKSSI